MDTTPPTTAHAHRPNVICAPRTDHPGAKTARDLARHIGLAVFFAVFFAGLSALLASEALAVDDQGRTRDERMADFRENPPPECQREDGSYQRLRARVPGSECEQRATEELEDWRAEDEANSEDGSQEGTGSGGDDENAPSPASESNTPADDAGSGGTDDYGFNEVDRSEPAYKAYTISDYQFAFYLPDDQDASWFWSSGKKFQNFSNDINNQIASAIFMIYVLIMKGTMMLLGWVLDLDLVTALRDTIAAGMTDIGNTIIGSGPAFTTFVKIMWGLGVAAVVFALFRARVASAAGKVLTMVVVTAIAAIIVMFPGKAIDYYTGIVGGMTDGVLTLASGEEGSQNGSGTTITDGYMDQMWEAYVIVPFGQIQVSYDPEVAADYDEKALATPGEERADALKSLGEDEESVATRASTMDYVMHQVWAGATAIFGLFAVLILLLLSSVVLAYQLIAIVALITLPVWLWFAILPAGGIPSKIVGWFLVIIADVVLVHLMLALFVLVNESILTVETPDEDMALILRFLLSVISGIAVIAMVFAGRNILKTTLTGRALTSGGSGLYAAQMLSRKGGDLKDTVAGTISGPSSSGTNSSEGYVNPRTAEARNQAASADSGHSGVDEADNELNEKRRAEHGEAPIDDRTKSQKNKEALKRFGGMAERIGWNTAGGTAKAGGRLMKAGGHAAKRLPLAGMMAARSGFMPFETAAAFGGVGAAAGAGVASGAAGLSRDKLKEKGRSRIERRRQQQIERKNAGVYASDEARDAHDTLAAQQYDDWKGNYSRAESDAEDEYNRLYEPTEDQPANDGPANEHEEHTGPSSVADPREGPAEGEAPSAPYERPENIPAAANFNEQTGAVWGTYDPATESAPIAPAGYTGETAAYQNPANEDGSRTTPTGTYLFTPHGQSRPDRKHYDHRGLGADERRGAYDQEEELRKGSRPREERRGDGEHAQRLRGEEAREDQLRADQREGIVADGYTKFDDWHADNKRKLFGEKPTPKSGERSEDFLQREATWNNQMRNYDPANYTPGGGQGHGQGQNQQPQRVQRDKEWIKQNDPEAWNNIFNERVSDRLTPQQISSVEKGMDIEANPEDQRKPYDQPLIQENASTTLKENITAGLHTREEMETGMKRPEDTDQAGWQRFRDRLSTVRNTRRGQENTPDPPGEGSP